MFPSLLLTSALALANCSGASCAARSPAYTWHTFAADPGRSYLYCGDTLVAGYDHDKDIYRTYDAGTDAWNEPAPPPWQPARERIAAPRESEQQVVPNYGVDLARLEGERGERYRLNGVPVARERARQALAGASIPDDAGRLRLTIIGDPVSAGRITTDLAAAPPLAAWKDRLLVQSYPPEHWAVAKAGFFTGGKPTVYLQAPSGKVLHRQDDYADGADGLAQALRRADPNYDAAHDPDLRKRMSFDLSRIPLPAWILAGAVLLGLLFRRA